MSSPGNPGFVTGQVPTAAQWNSYFTVKADAPTGATLTSGSSIAMTTSVLLINKTIGSATAVMLPSSPETFTLTYVIKDQKGDAGTNNITVTPASGLIDGAASFLMNVNYMASSFVFDGTNWSVVG